jgi:hypothetical protein
MRQAYDEGDRMKTLLLMAAALPLLGQVTPQHHFLIIGVDGEQLGFNESFLLRDTPEGSLLVFLPEDIAANTRVMVDRTPGKLVAAGHRDQYEIPIPAHQGELVVTLQYAMPYSSPAKIERKVMYKGLSTQVAVPAGMTVSGEGVEARGTRGQLAVYSVARERFALTIEGKPAAPPDSGESEGPGIQQILPRLYDSIYLVLGLSLAILALGFILMYRRSQAR